MKSPVKHYLSISKKEWNGMVILILLIAIVLAAPYVYQICHKDKLITFKEFDADVALLKSNTSAMNAAGGKPANVNPHAYTYSPKIKPGEYIELNSADSARLTLIHGVGPVFARRIIKYRDRLGGFYQKEQLKEVFGMDADKYTQISAQVKIDSSHLSPINVNTATFEQLKRFPYLTFKQMNAVIQYRIQHGRYSSINDMRNIAILNDEILHKIQPYLTF